MTFLFHVQKSVDNNQWFRTVLQTIFKKGVSSGKRCPIFFLRIEFSWIGKRSDLIVGLKTGMWTIEIFIVAYVVKILHFLKMLGRTVSISAFSPNFIIKIVSKIKMILWCWKIINKEPKVLASKISVFLLLTECEKGEEWG